MEPKDYVEPPKIQKQTSVQRRDAEDKKDQELLASVKDKYQRIDGKELTAKQQRDIITKLKKQKMEENPEFDPRKHRLTHGIRNYKMSGEKTYEPGAFSGAGTSIGMTK